MEDKAYTVAELREVITAFASEFGPSAHITLRVNSDWTLPACSCTAYPDGLPGDSLSESGGTWDEAIARTRRAWLAREAKRVRETVDKMALQIIRVTHDHGKCTDAALRLLDFKAEDIERLGPAACHRAGVMARRAPFVIERQTEGANAA